MSGVAITGSEDVITITTPGPVTVTVNNPEPNLAPILERLDSIMATQAQLEASLGQVGDQLDKAKGEITAAIDQLKTEVQNAGNSTPGVDAAMARLSAAAQALDDVVPDTNPT